MRLSCPCCRTEYAVPIAKMPRGYCKVVCSHCGYKWRKAIRINTNFTRQKIDFKKNVKMGSTVIDRPAYRLEVLAILREEAAAETRLRRL